IKAVSAAERFISTPTKPATQPGPRLAPEPESKLAAQAARGLAAAIRQGNGSVTMRLQPAGLGDLKIHVNLAHGRVEASFEAQSNQARHLLTSSLSDLRSALEA